MRIFLTEKEFLTILSKVFISFELMISNNIAINREAERIIKSQKARKAVMQEKIFIGSRWKKRTLKKSKELIDIQETCEKFFQFLKS